MQVKRIEHTMDEWSQSIDKLLLKHHWLLLFNLSKLFRLSKFLTSEFRTDDNAMGIMQEICFLFSGDIKSREKVWMAIKVIVIALALHLANCSYPLFYHFTGFVEHITKT